MFPSSRVPTSLALPAHLRIGFPPPPEPGHHPPGVTPPEDRLCENQPAPDGPRSLLPPKPLHRRRRRRQSPALEGRDLDLSGALGGAASELSKGGLPRQGLQGQEQEAYGRGVKFRKKGKGTLNFEGHA